MASRRCWSRKNRKQGGGAYQFTGASIASPGTVNNFGQVHAGSQSGTPDCSLGVKTDTLGFTGSPALPGMQRGGRYGFDLSTPLGGGTPFSSGIPQVVSIPCEASTTRQSGGAVAYFAPTAGYDNKPSGWVGGTGAPVMLQVPYEARSYPTKGGSRRGRKGRKTRSRKGTKGRKTRSRKGTKRR